MGVLEQITQMRNQGISDEEIIRTFQEKGISPREINDALSQFQIKNAVSDARGYETPMPKEYSEEPPTENYEQPQQEYYPQEQYSQNEYEYPAERTDSDTIIEIAEQVFSEKIKTMKKQLDALNEFKTLGTSKIDNIDERLKRIETMIDKLQIAILEKIGSYGKNIENIKKEMSMMQDSFGKVINQAVKGAKVKKISKKK